MFTKIPTDIIKSKDISNLEFRVLSVLIMVSSYNNGHSYFGSFKLSEMCGIGRAALRKALSKLEQLKFLTITQRGDFSRSNDICLTLNNGLESLRLGGVAKKAPEVDLKDSPSKNEQSIEYMATPDVAGVLSMPCGEQVAANDLAKDVCDDALAAKIQAILPILDEYFGDLRPWIQVFEFSNKIGIRVLGGRISGVDVDVVKGFAARNGIFFQQEHIANERIIAA